MSCGATGCANASVIAWERWMTDAEIAQYHASGDLPAHETSGKLMVYACEDHQLDPAEMMSATHDAVCSAPPVCDCSVSVEPVPPSSPKGLP